MNKATSMALDELISANDNVRSAYDLYGPESADYIEAMTALENAITGLAVARVNEACDQAEARE